MPAGIQRALALLAGRGFIHRLWRRLTTPVNAWSLHAVSMWVWHIPALFAAALANEAIHVLQHTSFFASALLFWSVTTRGEWLREERHRLRCCSRRCCIPVRSACC